MSPQLKNSQDLAPLTFNSKVPPRAPINGGNTCYIDSLIVALFAEFDGWDGLLQSSNTSSLVSQIRAIANDLRSGKVIRPETLNTLRDILIDKAGWHRGRGQHDAAELFACLLDKLHAPFVPLVKNLSHHAAPDSEADHTPFTERMLWLNLYTEGDNHLKRMVDNYFFAEVVHGLLRDGAPSGVDANVFRSLIPAYTPVRETGEVVSVTRNRFDFMTIPFAISRFNASGDRKNMSRVIVPTALPATLYVGPFAAGMQHTLILRSVVCHLGNTMRSGHYVAYTYSAGAGGWRRWDDLDEGPVRSAHGDTINGEPVIRKWAEEIRRNCYLLFYELVPGESYPDIGSPSKPLSLKEITPKKMYLDEQLAAQVQFEEDQAIAAHEQNMLAGGGMDISFAKHSPLSESQYPAHRTPNIESVSTRPKQASIGGSVSKGNLNTNCDQKKHGRFRPFSPTPKGGLSFAHNVVHRAASAVRKDGDSFAQFHINHAFASLNDSIARNAHLTAISETIKRPSHSPESGLVHPDSRPSTMYDRGQVQI